MGDSGGGLKKASPTSEVTNALWSSLAAMAALFAALGLNGDRFFAALHNFPLVAMAPALAILAIGCNFSAYLSGHRYLLIAGSAVYICALAASLVFATLAATGNGRPTVTSVDLEGQRPHISLKFTVHAVGVERNDHVAVFVRAASRVLYSSSLRSDDMGKVDQEVVIPLSLGKEEKTVTINVTNSGDKGRSQCTTHSPTAPACVTVETP